MNYNKQLSGFYQRVAADNRLNPTQESLYKAIFQFWNAGRFQNPVSISRYELMRISKICAKATYHKCIKDLHNFGYINYQPSYNPFKGSLVYLFDFQTTTELVPTLERIKNRTSSEHVLYNINYINENNINGTTPKNDIVLKVSKNRVKVMEPKVAEKTLKENFSGAAAAAVIANEVKQSQPTLDEVHTYFLSQNSTEVEAQKFYNYFQSNGWKVGGKTPMKDWQAAARNWILNIPKFNQQLPATHKEPTSGNLNANTNKDYSEPL